MSDHIEQPTPYNYYIVQPSPRLYEYLQFCSLTCISVIYVQFIIYFRHLPPGTSGRKSSRVSMLDGISQTASEPWMGNTYGWRAHPTLVLFFFLLQRDVFHRTYGLGGFQLLLSIPWCWLWRTCCRWRKSSFHQWLRSGSLDLPEPKCWRNREEFGPKPYTIVADDAFAMSTYLLEPCATRDLSRNKRRVSENAFGILASRFRILLTNIFRTPERAVEFFEQLEQYKTIYVKKAETSTWDLDRWIVRT